jgi:hypothetical protein
VYADGGSLTIEQAWSNDEPAQAMEYLERLQGGTRTERMRFSDVLARFEQYSIYGQLEPRRQLRFLAGDIYEIKTAEDRILFYEIPASTGHKRAVRVTNACEKGKSKTAEGKLPRKHLERAFGIERLDRSHDTQ